MLSRNGTRTGTRIETLAWRVAKLGRMQALASATETVSVDLLLHVVS
jgi:hypothetical protein